MDWDGHVAIIWDEGPYEWTYHFGTDDVDEELTIEVQEFQTWRRGPAPPGHHAQRGVRRAVHDLRPGHLSRLDPHTGRVHHADRSGTT